MPSIRLIRQPDGSGLCGQCCVAMAAGVSLDRAIEVIGRAPDAGTHTCDIRRGLRALGIDSAPRCRLISRNRPIWPRRAMLVMRSPERKEILWHWVLAWDGEILDPSDAWPDRYRGWQITSFLEIKA